MKRGEQDAGFALIEVVVSAAIVAMMMGLTYQAIAANAQAGRIVAERRAAVLLAQSVLDQATAAPDAADLVRSGRSGGLAWQVESGGYDGGGRNGGRTGGPALDRIAVRVRDVANGKPVFMLQTLRLSR